MPRVARTGLEVLGFPAGWVQDFREVLRIKQALQKEDQEDPMRLSTQGQKPEDMGRGGSLPLPGSYHVIILDVDDSYSKRSSKGIFVDFKVLAGTTPGQEQKAVSEFFFLPQEDTPDFAVERVTRLCWAAGLLAANESKDVDLGDLVGRQLVIELQEEADKDKPEKKYIKIAKKSGGMWPLDHEEVRDVPKDKAAASLKAAARSDTASVGAAAGSSSDSNDPLAGL